MFTVIAPVSDNLAKAIRPYRRQYDPMADKLPPNITILKPFDFSGAAEDLHTHLEAVGEMMAPIKVSLIGWDVYRHKLYWVCLPLIGGSQAVVDLRDELLTGPLESLSGKDTTYRPHIIFGRFTNQEVLNQARHHLKDFEPQFTFRITKMELWHRLSNDDPWQHSRDFGFKATVPSDR